MEVVSRDMARTRWRIDKGMAKKDSNEHRRITLERPDWILAEVIVFRRISSIMK